MKNNINDNNCYNLVMSKNFIFSLMYGPHLVQNMVLEDQIIQINTKDLMWASDKKKFYYIWGWPSPDPDFHTYTAKTYGRGWAFTKDEIINTNKNTKRKRKEKNNKCNMINQIGEIKIDTQITELDLLDDQELKIF